MDSRKPRDGRTIEEVGLYHPIEVEDKQVQLKDESIKSWISKGAKPSPAVKKILNKHNIFMP